MAHSGEHPRANPGLGPVLVTLALVCVQVVLLQMAVNRLVWGQYQAVLPAAAATGLTYVLVWLVARLS